MKTILIATDFSEHAQTAGKYAIRLASRLDANLVCVHATSMNEANPNAYEVANGKLEEFRVHLQTQQARKRKWLELLSDEAGRQGVKSQHHLVDGRPEEAICAATEEVDANLVIMGSHGHTGLARILLGSVAEKVVRLCKSSVLVARPPLVGEDGFHHVLVATDFTDHAMAALDQACALASRNATIDILHCWQVDSFADPAVGLSNAFADLASGMAKEAEMRGKELVERVAKKGLTGAFHLFSGRPTAGVQSFIEEQEHAYDLVAVGTQGRTGLSRLLLGSVAEVTVRYSPCSVLVART